MHSLPSISQSWISPSVALLVVCVACAPRGEQPAPVVELFEPLSPDAVYEAPEGPWADQEVRRARYVRFSEEAFREGILTAAAGESFSITLFPDLTVLLTESRVRELDDGSLRWKASDATEHFVRLSMIVAESVMLGTVRVDDSLYEIVPVERNVVRIAEIDQTRYPQEARPRIPPEEEYPRPGEDRPEDGDEEPPAAGDEGDGRLRVLVVLAEPAFSVICEDRIPFIDLPALIENSFQSNLNDVFQAIQPSGVSADVVLACHDYDPVGGDLNDDLDFVTADAGIAALRDAHVADLVSLLVPSADFCGRGWETYPVEADDEAWTFSVVRASCALGNFSFAHELGHNFGMHHDRETDDAWGSETCNYGHIFPVDLLFVEFDARTVMSYDDPCDGCPRLGLYSMPQELDLGPIQAGPFGVGCSSVASGGDFRRADNRQQLIDAAPTVAAFR